MIKKKIFFLALSLLFLFEATAYTPPSYGNVELVLSGSQTPASYTNIELVLGDAPTDSCSCPSVDTNWEIDMSDYCNITSDCNIGGGNITFTGEGITTFDAVVNASYLQMPLVNQLLNVTSYTTFKGLNRTYS